MKASQTHHQKQYCRKGGNHRCGSGLARESGVSVDIDMTDTAPSRASPFPHGFMCVDYWLGVERATIASTSSPLCNAPYTRPAEPSRLAINPSLTTAFPASSNNLA